MEYTKIQNNDENNNEIFLDKKIKLIYKENENSETKEKSKVKIINQTPIISERTGNILIVMLLIIFIFLVFICQNITSNITKLTNTNELNQEKEEISKKEEDKEKNALN